MRKFLRKVSVFLCMICLLAMDESQVRAVHTGEETQAEEVKKEILVGYVSYDHMIREEPDGTCSGYGVEYLNELSKKTGWTYRYVKVEEDERISKLINGEIDLLCSLHNDCDRNDQLLFSANESGMEYAMLCALKENDQIFYNDYEAIDGKKIGINKNSDLEESLLTYAKRNDFTYEAVYFENFEDMQQALNEKKVDIILASSLREIQNVRYVGKGFPIKEYFVTGRGNAELMSQLNQADELLKQERPFYISALHEAYYGPPYQKLTGITREEHEFIDSGQTVRVVCDAESYPIEYRDEESGEYAGIYRDALNLISEESGLKFEYILLDDYSKAWDMLEKGEADMIAGSYGNSRLAQYYNLTYSKSYISAEYTLVGNKEMELSENPTIAFPRNYRGIREYFMEKEPSWEIILYDNVKECLQAVNKGEVDLTSVNSIFLQTVYNLNNYDNLRIVPNMTKSIPICIGVGSSRGEVLKSVLDKAITQVPAAKFQKCITENAINISYTPTFWETFENLVPYIAGALFLFVLIVALIIAKREKHFRHLAMTDSVTGLWNGVKFVREAQELLEKNKDRTYLLITLDINKFKFINNDFGSEAGDKILLELGRRIQKAFVGQAYYARNTADIFYILVEESAYREEMLEPLGEEVCFDSNGKKQYYKISVKTGIRVIPAGEGREEITRYADQAALARKTVKESANEDVAYYDEEMKENIARDLAIENRMEEALKNREFQVYLQPKYNLQTEEITGAEALVRWVEPDGRMVLPDMFIPLFEKNGFILKVDFFVYEEVMKRMAEWIREGRSLVCVSANVSRVHIGTTDFFEKLNGLIEKYGVPKECFELELTETIMGGERSMTRTFIRECKEEGYKVSIDDFGIGYSSLNLLKDLPVDILKIDKGFLDETEESRRSSIIVEQVVEMAKKMEIGTLCEGVETPKQAAFLKQIGCDMAQGYLFSRPIPMEDFEKMI